MIRHGAGMRMMRMMRDDGSGCGYGYLGGKMR